MSEILKKIKESKKRLFVGLAGPGTGKSMAFKTIIESDEYKGKKVLILSFIKKLINDLSADFKDFDNVEVSTLHAFAKQKIGDIDLNEDLDDIVSKDYLFIKGEDIEYNKKFYEDNLTEDEEKFYKERKNFYKYQKELYSFNSIIYAVNLFFKQYEDEIPSEYDLILIDEFQDFNKSEYELIKLLNKKSKIVVVGDDDQSLYGDFRSAEPEQIRDLYNHHSTEEFSLDYCYRSTEVIIAVVNSLIANAKKRGYLENRLEGKKFLYPKKREDDKNEVSKKYPKVDFIPSVSGSQLIYQLAERIKKDVRESKKRTLILVPSYLKQTIYEGLAGEGFNIVEFELFSDEICNKIKHKKLIKYFTILTKRKTDNLALRNILSLYLKDNKIKELIKKSNKEGSKKIWFCLEEETKEKIEKDIEIFKKVKKGENKLNDHELKRFSEVFTLKKILSKIIKGFNSVIKNAIEIEMTTVMSSKGLSADFVYYIGIDDRNILDKETKKFTNQKICEFLVGITRAREKLTLISMEDENPKILQLIDNDHINKIQ